ncbi:MAG TPA: hypothetical protein VFE88_04075 [Candidatus Nanoarchaeia archaeon]|nr:hypothetical protein [Candidatus Nanoarchaeia archaeon]
MKSEVIGKLKELKELSRVLEVKIEADGLKISDPLAGIAKEQFFNNNLRGITSAMEGLLRGEAAERHTVRLEKEFPAALKNVKKLKDSAAGMKNADSFERVEALLTYLENTYLEL